MSREGPSGTVEGSAVATNMAFGTVGNVIVALHTASPPSQEEWSAYIQAVKRLDLTKIIAIAFSDGGGPNSAQRKQLNETLKGRARPSVVLTGNAFVRSVVTTLAWFNPMLKAFSPERAPEAFDYLKLTRAESEAVRAQVRLLAAQFAPPLRCVAV